METDNGSFFDGYTHIATEYLVCSTFGPSGGVGFGCHLCGRKFETGDKFRFIYMNDGVPSPGNFFVCSSCDRPEIAELVRAAIKDYMLGRPHMKDWVLAYMLQEEQRAHRVSKCLMKPDAGPYPEESRHGSKQVQKEL